MRNDLRELLAGYIDGELSDEERAAVERALAENPKLRAELEEFRKLKEVTGMAQYADLPEEAWEKYWEALYRKLERGIGWVLLSVGTIILLLFGTFTILKQLFVDPAVPLWVKAGVSAATVGAVVLLVSYGRQTFYAFKRDRYRNVTR